MARVVVLTLGGTIAMAGTAAGGVVARIGGYDLVSTLGGVDGIDVEVIDVLAAPSADLTLADVLALARRAADLPADGFVVTQGTDTLEETAFALDLAWPYERPLVVTGAMRNPTLAGADGPANLLAAVRVAAAAPFRGQGALVVLADEIHAARSVIKAHTSSPSAFVSPDSGPIGVLVEGAPRLLAGRPRAPVLTVASGVSAARIALWTAVVDDDGGLLDAVDARYDGLVVAGLGGGHVPGRVAARLETLAARIPVVLSSRTGGGSVLRDTYGAVGAERDLLRRGLVHGGFLPSVKARILLALLVGGGYDVDAGFAPYR